MKFDNDYELAMIWFALLMDQKNHEEGTKEWFRRESVIRRLEDHLSTVGLMATTLEREMANTH
jgi:predicted secreted Zn-dependent protease